VMRLIMFVSPLKGGRELRGGFSTHECEETRSGRPAVQE
jgi:hypothetical protein